MTAATVGTSEGRSGRSGPAVWLVPPLLAGAALRFWNLGPQILGGDELWAPRTAILARLPEILTIYPPADDCIPLTALDRLLVLAGVRLSEPVLRAPSLLCGLLFLALAPLAVERRLGMGTAVSFAWLAALSPLLALYSRIARPYMPVVLLTAIAAVAFYRWWERPRLRPGAAFVLAAALAVWLHLVAAPFVVAPFLFAVGDLAARARRRRDGAARSAALLLLALALALACAAFLGPAWRSLLTLIARKRSPLPVPWTTIVQVLRAQVGTAQPTVAALLWLAAAAGVVLLLRRDLRLAIYTATLAAGFVALLALLSPVGLYIPVVLARYLIPILPLVLLWAALALAALVALIGRLAGPALGMAAGAVLLLLLAAAGPFADRRFRASSFLHHNDFVAFTSPRSRLPAVSPFYRWLARAPGDGAVIEFPWIPLWTQNSAFYIDQEVHGHRVLVASPMRLLYRPELALRNLVAPYPAGLCASGARFLSIHLHIAHEEDLVRPPAPWMVEPMESELRRALRSEGEGMARRLGRLWGPPSYHDETIAVWDLGRLCARGGKAG